jgi:hypothetical protein
VGVGVAVGSGVGVRVAVGGIVGKGVGVSVAEPNNPAGPHAVNEIDKRKKGTVQSIFFIASASWVNHTSFAEF